MNRLAIPLLFFVCLFAVPLVGQDYQPTTFYIVRHAERDGTNDALTEAGELRAKELAVLMKSLRIKAVYSTDTQRTQSTAKPTAETLELEIQSYNELSPAWFNELKSDHQGHAVLIVGHSNTSGMIANELGGEGDFSLGEDEYDNLFIVKIEDDQTSALRIRFGNTSDH